MHVRMVGCLLACLAPCSVLPTKQPPHKPPLPRRLKAPDLLVPINLNGALPSYLMVGGLVINVASAPLLSSEHGSIGGSPTGLQDQLWFGVKNETDEQASGAPLTCSCSTSGLGAIGLLRCRAAG